VIEPNISQVRAFWEQNPLFVGESTNPPGSPEFFSDHTNLVLEDCFEGYMDPRVFPASAQSASARVLDAGCGIGFWLEQFAKEGFTDLTGLDISEEGLRLARLRLKFLGHGFPLIRADIEDMPLEANSFDHVNCQGVVHHTVSPERAIAEFARILRPGGTLGISVYHQNIFLHWFKVLRPIIRIFGRFGFGLVGRGREKILMSATPEEVVRKFDGENNPIGKSYSKKAFIALVSEHFIVQETFIHFFPRRVFPWIPKFLHTFLGTRFGFMIYINAKKKSSEAN
jgi:SAM-dependent methyltransferase